MKTTTLSELALLAIFTVHGAIEVLEPYHKLREQDKRNLLVRKTGWYASYVNQLSAADFHLRFRIWPSALHELVCRIEGWDDCAMDDRGWQRCLKTDTAKFICHASYYLVTGMCIISSASMSYVHVNIRCNAVPDCSIRQAALALDTAPTTIHRWIMNGIQLLNSLLSIYVRFPNVEECAMEAARFETFSGIRGAIGAVDCSHIAVKPRAAQRSAYTNRKSFYSLHLLAIVSATGKFLFIDTGCSGSMADPAVLRTSKVCVNQTHAYRTNTMPPIPPGYFLLADAGFMTVPWVP